MKKIEFIGGPQDGDEQEVKTLPNELFRTDKENDRIIYMSDPNHSLYRYTREDESLKYVYNPFAS